MRWTASAVVSWELDGLDELGPIPGGTAALSSVVTSLLRLSISTARATVRESSSSQAFSTTLKLFAR